MQDIIERVTVDLDEDEIRRLIDAVEHYEAYLHSQAAGRDEIPRAARAAEENAREARFPVNAASSLLLIPALICSNEWRSLKRAL
jgi:hypothetical protein